MKKTAVLVIVFMLTALATAAMAGDRGQGKGGKLFLFQKCDEAMYELEPDLYTPSGCPTADGPWPIMFQNRRWGQMHYNLVGDIFKFSFQGKKLLPDTDYTLIYYPDPWPGNNLIRLSEGRSNEAGNLQLHGNIEIFDSIGDPSGLPTPDDANYYAKGELPEGKPSPSGATGAKIWLVLTDDLAVTLAEGEPDHMRSWNPSAYLFEGNLIVYQYANLNLDEYENSQDPEMEQEGFEEEYSGPARENNGQGDQAQGQGGGNGKAKSKNK